MPIQLNGKKLKKTRKAHKLTQEKLAECSGISDRYERAMENGDYFNPTVTVLYPICQALHIPMEELRKRKLSRRLAPKQ